jgi:hypothetical protein
VKFGQELLENLEIMGNESSANDLRNSAAGRIFNPKQSLKKHFPFA